MNYSKIFIRGVDWVGTLVLATPVYRTVRENFPESKITVCVRPWSMNLLETCPYIDEILVYNPSNIFDRIKFLKKIKKEKYDIAILLSGNFESALLCFLAGIKKRIGYPYDHRGFLLTDVVPEIQDKYCVSHLLNIVETLGLKIKNRTPEIWLTEEDKKFADDFFEKNNLKNSDLIVGIGFGVRGEESRMWPLQNFAELINLLYEKDGAKIILFGSKYDEKYLFNMKNFIKVPFINLVGQTTLRQFASVVKRCSVYVTNDTGGMHIASVSGAKVVALFGPTSFLRWGPFGDNCVIINKKIDCSPCEFKKMKNCKDNICMKNIKVEEVYQKIFEVIPKNV